jgi:apolipoprotein D and lipocalin family protein
MKYFLLVLMTFASTFAHAAHPALETVSSVDLNRYIGKWYEIAAFPQSFEKNCTATTAEYSLLPGGKVRVLNSCRLKTLDGKLKVAKGWAKIADRETNAKLKVTFFWPFFGDYWILDLGADYDYVMVGSPDRNYLWFLSRTPALPEETLAHLRAKAEDLGFDVSRLKPTLQAVE